MQSPPLILAFDTSAAHCAAALLRGDQILAQSQEEMAKGQAERLMPLLEETLSAANLTWADLHAVAVGIGPGNFTGIRISVSAARGLALGLDVPAIGVSTLEALATGHAGPTVASLDARRDHLYVQGAGAPQFCTLDSLPDLPQGATCIGFLADELAQRCKGTPAEPRYPIAEAIARIAATRLNQPGQPDLPAPAPLYLREADAAPARDLPPALLDD